MTRIKMAVAAALVATVLAGTAMTAGATPPPKYRAEVGPYTAAHSGVIVDGGVTGTAKMKVHGDQVVVDLKAEGLEPGKTYPAHIHFGQCTQYLGHFKYDTSITTASEDNEVWLSLTANRDGRAHAKVERPLFDTAQALSLVIHEDTTNSAPLRRIACGDFVPTKG